MASERANVSVTMVIENRGEFLLVARDGRSENFPNLWAFPGGKVEVGETLIEAARREVLEETGLRLGSSGAFLDSYWFKKTAGAAFLFQSLDRNVILDKELSDYVWVKSLRDMQNRKCVEGIHNHLHRALQVIERDQLVNIDELNLTRDKYINE